MVQFCVWKIIEVKSERVHTLAVGITTLGRGESNMIQCSSILASRYHCEILLCEDGSIFIKDKKSLNGTFLGNEKILPEREVSLKDGDLVGIGVETSDLSCDTNFILKVKQTILRENEKPAGGSFAGIQTVVPLHRFRPFGGYPAQEIIHLDHNSQPSSRTKSSIGSHQLPPQLNDPIPSTSTGITDQQSKIALVIPKLETIDIESEGSEIGKRKDDNQDPVHSYLDCDDVICIESDEEDPCPVDDKKNFTDKSTVNAIIPIKSDAEENVQSVDYQSVQVRDKERGSLSSGQDVEEWTVISEIENDDQGSREKSEALPIVPTEGVGVQVNPNQPDLYVGSNAVGMESTTSIPVREKQRSGVDGNVENETTGLLVMNESISNENVENINHDKSFTNETGVRKTVVDKEKAGKVDASPNHHSTSHRLETSNKLERVSENNIKKNLPDRNEEVELNVMGSSQSIIRLEQVKSNSVDMFEIEKETDINLLEENETIIRFDEKINNKEIQDESKTPFKPILKNSEIDITCQDIINRRLSGNFQRSEENIDNFLNGFSKIPSDLKQDSFTVEEEDFETITIDDDDELPCSQMFDSIHEPPILETNENLVGPRIDLEDDELSETDSTDEWFQRLSQCNEYESSEDDDLDQDNDKIDYTSRSIENRIVDEDSDEINEGSLSELQKQAESDKAQKEIANCEVMECTLQNDKGNNTIQEGTDDKEIETDVTEERVGETEPLLRKTPKGSKRKLLESDDEMPAEPEEAESFQPVKEKTNSIDQSPYCRIKETHKTEFVIKNTKTFDNNNSSSKTLAENVHQENKKLKLNSESDRKLSKKYQTHNDSGSKPGPKCKKIQKRKSSGESISGHSSSSSSDNKRSKIYVSKDEKHTSTSNKRKHKSESAQPLEKVKSAKNDSDKSRHKGSDCKAKRFSDSDSSTGNSFDYKNVSKIESLKKNALGLQQDTHEDSTSEMSDDNFESFKEWHLERDRCLVIVERLVGIPENDEEPCPSKISTKVSEERLEINRTENNKDTRKKTDGVLRDFEEEIKSNTISKVNLSEVSASSNRLSEIPKTSLESRLSSEVKVGSELVNKEDKIPKPKRLSSEDAKLDAVSKKIGASLAKRPIQIIEAKSLHSRRKQSVSIEPGPNIKDGHCIEDTSKWLSKEHPPTKTILPLGSKSDLKAYRRQQLADISKRQKELSANNAEEKSKPINTAKNTTKITSKSRSEIFLDTLVSSDSTAKDKSVIDEQENKGNKKNKAKFKIPKTKLVPKESDQTSTNLVNTEVAPIFPGKSVKTTKLSKTALEAPKPLSNSVIKATKHVESKTSIENPSSTSNTSAKPAVDHLAEMDQILTTQISNTVNNKRNVRVAHVSKKVFRSEENKEPMIIKILPETKNLAAFDGTRLVKPILNKAGKGTLRGKENQKSVKFQHPGESHEVVYVGQRVYEIEEGNILKPVSKHSAKNDSPPVKKVQTLTTATYTSYWEETIHQICKWNLIWFDEKKKSELNKVEPPACSGQVYPLTETFDSYKDYRQGMFPLLLYELWQSLAKHFDLVSNKNRPFNIEILNVTSVPVRNQSLPLQRKDETRILSRLECQMLLDRDIRMLCPHQGDLVILDFQLQRSSQEKPVEPHKPDKRYQKRVLAYLTFNNIRSISGHKNVSPRLRQKSPNACQVMDFTLFIREQLQPIDKTQDTRIAVLKYIKSDLRQFDALDRLPSSPLLNMICSPKENCAPLPPVEIFPAATALIDNLNPSQKKAVLSVARSVITESTVLHFIHGPPGCGKSEVIIGIIRVLWQSWHENYRKGVREKAPRILLCAPSNAAIDDIFNRLMHVRQEMPKFNMLRIGRTDMTHKNVASLTLEYLVDKELKKSRDIVDDEQQKIVEFGSLEAKKNSINYQLENLGKRRNDFEYIRNLHKKLAETKDMMRALESGKPRKPLDGKELRERRRELELQLLENANVIATTLSSCYNGQMEQANLNKKLRLTCCIVDEATQCIEPETLIPLMLGVKSLILVGDPNQLPATVHSNVAKERGLERSLFARQQDWWKKPGRDPHLFESHCHLLNVQYRMHPAIAQWPSEYFYNRALKSDVDLEQRRSSALQPYVVLSHDSTQNRHEESNSEEATMVVSLVRDIMRSGLCNNFSIGVITPYNRQKDLIRRKIEEERLANVEVGTVDSYQGREQDIILFSCTRTEGVGFMAGTERLNVALTRARYSLIIIGNFKSLEKNPTWFSLLNNAKQRSVYKTIHGDEVKDLLPKVLRHSK